MANMSGGRSGLSLVLIALLSLQLLMTTPGWALLGTTADEPWGQNISQFSVKGEVTVGTGGGRQGLR